jgi:hypothetical protein
VGIRAERRILAKNLPELFARILWPPAKHSLTERAGSQPDGQHCHKTEKVFRFHGAKLSRAAAPNN